MEHISAAFRSQYRASLSMLRNSIAACPDAVWNDRSYGNRFWHIAYHALYFTALYLSPSSEAAVLWNKSRPWYHSLGKWSGAPDYDPDQNIPYTKYDLYELADFVLSRLDVAFDEVSMDAPSGFSWISFDKFQLHIYNLRHLEHHTGQLTERIKQTTGIGIAWVGKG
jgi:hypothetical protein